MRKSRYAGMVAPSALLTGLLLAVVGCSGAEQSYEAAASTTEWIVQEAVDEEHAADFRLPALSGETIRLSDTEGSVRLVDFWATWCPPCRDEIPMLNELHQAYRADGLTILAISDEKPDVVREFADEIGMEYTNLIDPGEVSQAYGVLGLPMAFIIDKNGRIVEQIMGPKSRKELEKLIRELLELPPTT